MTAETAGTEHSHWGIWGTWRGSPELVQRIARAVKDSTRKPAEINILCGDDVENADSDDDLEQTLTSQALKRFRTLVISAGDDADGALRVRIVFVRRPADVEIGANKPRHALVKAGVVLEVFSGRGQAEEVAETAREVANAIERGRPNWVTRPALRGRANRGDERPGFPPGSGASASRSLERAVRRWPKRNAFSTIFVLICLALYAGLVALLAADVIHPYDDPLALVRASVRWVILGLGAAVAVAAFLVQKWLFPPVEVAKRTRAGKVGKTLVSSVTITAVAGAVVPLLEFAGVHSLFS